MTQNCLLFVWISAVCCCSCNSPRFIYSPSPPNDPYFKERGDSKLAAYYSSGGDDNEKTGHKNNGYDLQAAYAISDHWALTAGFFARKEKDIYTSVRYNFFDSSILDYKRHITDLGGGYFIPLNRGKTVLFNIYGGLGFGKFSFTDYGIDKSGLSYERFHNSGITKWFIQPSINSIVGDYFRASFILKFSFVRYGNISTSYTNEELRYFFLDKIKNNTISYFEPTFNMQFGIPPVDWIKVDGGFTFSSDPYEDLTKIQARSFNASIGLCFDFFKMKK